MNVSSIWYYAFWPAGYLDSQGYDNSLIISVWIFHYILLLRCLNRKKKDLDPTFSKVQPNGLPIFNTHLIWDICLLSENLLLCLILRFFPYSCLAEFLIILNSKAHIFWPKRAQKGAQFFPTKKAPHLW